MIIQKGNRLLVLASRFPYPLEKGDKLRLYHQIKSLSREFEVYLFALSDIPVSDESIEALQPYCKEIKCIRMSRLYCFMNMLIGFLFKGLPFQVAYFYSGKTNSILQEFQEKHNLDLIYCQLIRMSEYVRKLSGTRHLDYMDAFSMGVKRRMEKSFWLKPLLALEYRRVKQYENSIFPLFHSHSIIASADRDFILPKGKEKIDLLPNGVDTTFFRPNDAIAKSYDISFVGNMNYPPNIAAAKYLIEEVMPKVWNQNPEVRVLIAGANPDKSVLKFQSDRVEISGWMEDIREAYWKSRIFVAPMFLGSGLQNKLLEAMAIGLPCITTDLANNSLNASSKEIKIANSSDAFSNTILDLLSSDKKELDTQILTAKDFIQAKYGWESHNRRLIEILQKSYN